MTFSNNARVTQMIHGHEKIDKKRTASLRHRCPIQAN